MKDIPHQELAGREKSSAARRRRSRRMLGRLRDREQQAFLRDLARQASPSVDLFLRSILAGLLFGLALRYDQRALLIGGALIAPQILPLTGLGLGALFGSGRYFIRLLLGFGVAAALAGITAGLAGGLAAPPGSIHSVLAAEHAALNPFDLALLLSGSFFLTLGLVKEAQATRTAAAAALAYELLLPIATAAFGLAHHQPEIWRGASLVFGLHLSWGAVMSIFALLLLGVRPRALAGRNFLIAMLLCAAAVAPAAISLGGVVIPNLPAAAPPPTSTPTPKPSATPSRTSTPAPTSTATSTARPSPSPTSTATATTSEFPLPAVVYNTGGEGAVVRQLPSTSAPVVGYRNEGDPLEIVGGPQLVEGDTWWMVLFENEGEQWLGWMLADLLTTPTPASTNTAAPPSPTP
jgi:hypothetical protein